MKLHHLIFLVPCSVLVLHSCSISKQISKQADSILLNDTAISKGNIGISIYEPATGKYWYNKNADKYFIPSSNTKLFTLYAGMKYLGDSLVGLKVAEYKNVTLLLPTGDPTLLYPSFTKQPVLDFLIAAKKDLWLSYDILFFNSYGNGWAWEDYNNGFMAERSGLPVYGNCVTFSGRKVDISYSPKKAVSNLNLYDPTGIKSYGYINFVNRDFHQNRFDPVFGGTEKKDIIVPFITSIDLTFELLKDTIHKNIQSSVPEPENIGEVEKRYNVYSQPSDSLFKPMMHNSDNFFAEQTLLMVSNERLGYMSDEDIIDTLLKTDLKDIPQKPRWVDGSGLSRYNLFTPLSFVYILEKMKAEFGMDRLKNILPTGGQGTLKNYFLNSSSFIYAKTGTISNNCALSGYLITKKGKLLIFSILVNNYPTGATPVRKAMEQFLAGIREKY